MRCCLCRITLYKMSLLLLSSFSTLCEVYPLLTQLPDRNSLCNTCIIKCSHVSFHYSQLQPCATSGSLAPCLGQCLELSQLTSPGSPAGFQDLWEDWTLMAAHFHFLLPGLGVWMQLKSYMSPAVQGLSWVRKELSWFLWVKKINSFVAW